MKPFKHILSNVSWMMLSEMIARLSRFVTLFVLASYFSNVEYGSVMLAIVWHELFRVLTRLGVGAKIIQCQDKELAGICKSAITLQWLVTILIATVQFLASDVIADYYQNQALSTLIKIMAVSHVIYPIVTIKVFLLQRANRLRYFGIASGTCIAFENLLVALLVFISSDVLMVAYAKIAAAMFWVLIFIPAKTSKYSAAWNYRIIVELLEFSIKLLGSELLKAFRWQADSLFAARLLSPENFGIYSFAKSASIGIGQTLSSAFISGIYPFLCEQIRNNRWALGVQQSSLIAVFLCFVFIAQSLLAPWYITLLFEERWADALVVASLLCVVAIPTLICDYVTTLLRVRTKVGIELAYMVACGVTLVIGFTLAKPVDASQIAWVLLAAGAANVLLGIAISYGLYREEKNMLYAHAIGGRSGH